ncbi:glycoside hydrolase [Coprinopsis marcescibilis]|uniref:Glycoside hydrolase n=1 Tax=Coprinopsis marcescibilis TaxID=230819 RepID=A0A5C3KK92_COPMA|nr:glycoside hydrolase [Coprinopsis marcescibilis]
MTRLLKLSVLVALLGSFASATYVPVNRAVSLNETSCKHNATRPRRNHGARPLNGTPLPDAADIGSQNSTQPAEGSYNATAPEIGWQNTTQPVPATTSDGSKNTTSNDIGWQNATQPDAAVGEVGYNETSLDNSTVTATLSACNLDGGYIAAAWYPSWLASNHPLESLSWGKYNVMTFSFATTTPDPSVLDLDAESQVLLSKFVQQAKEHGVSALVSVGGWGGSRYFSGAVATAESRTSFVKAVVDLATKYDLDGIDFDWEFPNKQAIGCNQIAADDTANYLKFLQELRQDPVGSKLVLTAAVGLAPFVGSDGQPLTDVSGFGEVFDFIAIMAYDVWGTWADSVGPNAPLQDSCAPIAMGSAASAVAAWSGAGFPANKIILGVPAYGRSYYVEPTNAVDASGQLSPYVPFDKTKQPLGENETGEQTVDQCGTTSGPSGLFNFEGLVSAGFLTDAGDAAAGVVYRFDECSQTAFAYKEETRTMISYDDAAAFAAKGKFVAAQGLGGFAIWHGVGDHNDILLDAVSGGMGVSGGSGLTQCS